jgi:hypothetical protein
MSVMFSFDEKGGFQFLGCISFVILNLLLYFGLHLPDIIPIYGASIGFIISSSFVWLGFHILRNSKYKYPRYFFEGCLSCLAMFLVNEASILLSKTFFDSKNFQILFVFSMMLLAGVSDYILNRITRKTPTNSVPTAI